MSEDSGTLLTRAPTHERRLANGLTVLVRENHSAPVVAIVTHVRAGYFDEPDRLVGISHVLEHMFFKGTERRGVGEIARETKAAGGYLNAGTIYDHTSYYTVLPSAALEQGLDIQSDALRHSEIDEAELRKELLVIIQEAKRKLDNPAAVATETLYEEMFDVHRLGRWRIGTEEGLRQLGRADVWEYYRNLYRPSNIILVIAGAVDAGHAFDLVECHYGDMPAGEVVKQPSPEEPDREEFRFREMDGDIVQTYAECGWRTPGTVHPDTAALDVVAAVLGQGRASRLYRGVREAGLVTGISAYNYTPTEIGVFGVSADLLPEDTRSALEGMMREVEALRRTPPAAREVERARNLLEARMLRRTETVQGQANLLADWQALGDWRLARQYLERLQATTAGDLHRLAQEYLAPERATLLVYRPAAAPPLGWTADDAAAALRAAAAASQARAGDERAKGPAAVDDGRATAPTAATGEGVEDGVHFYSLPGGARLAVRPRRTAPLVSMGIAFRGGRLFEPPGRAGVTRLMTRTSLKGTADRSAAQLAEAVEALGGSISPGESSDAFSWTLTVPSRHLSEGFELLAETTLRPRFPADEVERERKVMLSELEQTRDDMYRYPMRLFLQGAFPDHPYGRDIGVLEDAVRGLGRDELLRWHERLVLEGRPWVLAVGDLDPDAFAEAAARALAAVRAGEPAERPAAPVWPDGPHEEAERRAKTQTALAIGFPGPDRNHPDSYAFEVLSNAISGLGGRLFEELRGRRSLAYTVAAYPLTRWLGGAFVAYIATAPEREDEARRGIVDEFERLAEESIGREELERAQRYTIGAWKIRSQRNTAGLSDLAGALLLGDGLRELREYEDRIRAVTPVGIREAFQRHYDPDRLVEGIVRGTGGGT